MSNAKKLIFLILPCAAFLYSGWLKEARGPYYYGFNSDPEYAYLLNSLNLIQGIGPYHVDHPGTPLQAAGAVIIQAASKFDRHTNGEDLINGVLARPEFYLNSIQIVLSGILTVTLFFLGRKIYQASGSLKWALLMQSSPFWFFTLGLSVARVYAESLLVIISYLLVLLLYPRKQKEGAEQKSHASPLVLGILAGTGIMTKVTFLPIALFVLLLIPQVRARLYYIASLGITVGLWVIPMIPRLDYFVPWITGVITHTGKYGEGERGFPKLEKLSFLLECFGDEPLYCALVLTPFIFIALAFIMRLKSNSTHRGCFLSENRALLSHGLFQIAFLLIITTEPEIHYLVPVFPLAILGLAHFRNRLQNELKLFPKSCFYAACLSLGLCLTLQATAHALNISSIKEQTRDSIEAENYAKELPPHVLLAHSYGASSQQFALYFGDNFSGYHYRNSLQTIYPNNLWYSIWGQIFVHNLAIVSDEGFDKMEKIVVVHGSTFTTDGLAEKPKPINGKPFHLLKKLGNQVFWICDLSNTK